MGDGEMIEKISNASYAAHIWLIEVAEAPLISDEVRIAAGKKAAEQLMEHRYAVYLYQHSENKKLPPEVRKAMKDAAELVLSSDTDSKLGIASPEKLGQVQKNRKISPKSRNELSKNILLMRGLLGFNTWKN
ncbi:Uncharacterised protein [uncultured archaeon]|nr:Uncharacterised protein [uncultured archaeon]